MRPWQRLVPCRRDNFPADSALKEQTCKISTDAVCEALVLDTRNHVIRKFRADAQVQSYDPFAAKSPVTNLALHFFIRHLGVGGGTPCRIINFFEALGGQNQLTNRG